MDAISKTQRKKAMLALQSLGEELTGLNHQQLEQLPLSETLLEAVLEAKRMTKFGARKRQLQYIGRLMRDVDAQLIRDKLDTLRGQSREHAAWLHKVERWRDRLLADDGVFDALKAECPAANIQRLRELVQAAQRESLPDKRYYRELFQELKKMVNGKQ
jgi:ribosome-associated protein